MFTSMFRSAPLLADFSTSTVPSPKLPPRTASRLQKPSAPHAAPHPRQPSSHVRASTIPTMAADELPPVAVPGHVLGPASRYTAGPGTHTHQGNVVSSLLGRVHVAAPAKAPGPAKRLNKITAAAPEDLPTVSVARHGRRREILPDVNNVVLARVVRLMPKQAIVVIQQVGDSVLQTEWQGVIRVQDVRATEKDKVKMYESFKPGDIVKAQVVRFAVSASRWTGKNRGG